MTEDAVPVVPPEAVGRAIRFSYAQAMLGAVYAASTGGMFLIGFALKLGAGNVEIGLLSTVPMFCVVMQLFSSLAIERGVSRRKLSLWASLVNVSCWALVIAIPYAAGSSGASVRVAALIAALTFLTLFGHLAGNARGSWLGDLIPPGYRGTFFGRAAMFWGIVSAGFAVIEGLFLDRVKDMGIGAFSALFGFGMLFGLASATLFLPQPEMPLTRHDQPTRFTGMVRATFTNRSLMMVTLFAVLWSLQGVAGPFYTTYLLRDLKMSFFGLGILNAVLMAALLGSSPFWGRMVDRFGCRPVLTLCSGVLAPLPLVWLGLTDSTWVYIVIPWTNALAGFAVSGVSVALSTLVYKVTPSAGRSVQLAIYSIVVTLLAAPMPTVGGYLPGWLARLGFEEDLRYTFYLSSVMILASSLASRLIPEPDSQRARVLARHLPALLWFRPWRVGPSGGGRAE